MQLCIDAADDHPGIALAVDGVAGPTLTWETERNHSVELLPNIDRLLTEAGAHEVRHHSRLRRPRPGRIRGAPRRRQHRQRPRARPRRAHRRRRPPRTRRLGRRARRRHATGRIVAVHRAGRGELAWAAYTRDGDAWREASAPHDRPRPTHSPRIAKPATSSPATSTMRSPTPPHRAGATVVTSTEHIASSRSPPSATAASPQAPSTTR